MPEDGFYISTDIFKSGDYLYDGATHEYMHTLTGTGVKANQGRNAAVYAIWEELIRRGKATDAFFRAADAKIASLSPDK